MIGGDLNTTLRVSVFSVLSYSDQSRENFSFRSVWVSRVEVIRFCRGSHFRVSEPNQSRTFEVWPHHIGRIHKAQSRRRLVSTTLAKPRDTS